MPQYAKPCRECGRHSHTTGSRNCKGCPAAKMACFNCGMVRYFERVCQKPKRRSSNRSVAIRMRNGSCIFATRVYTKSPRKTGWFGKVNQKGKANILTTPTFGRECLCSTSSTPKSINQMTDYEWLERNTSHLNLRWLAHKWCQWRKQCIGGQTAQPTGGENGTNHATNIIKWMRLSRKL